MKMNLVLKQDHGFTIQEMERMYPWERLVYTDFIMEKRKEDIRIARDAANFQRNIQSSKVIL